MRKEYSFPIKLEIKSDNPDLDAKMIAEAIHDAVKKYGAEVFHGEYFDMEYGIYIKANKEEFSLLGI